MKPSAYQDEYKKCETYAHHSQTAESQNQKEILKVPRDQRIEKLGGDALLKRETVRPTSEFLTDMRKDRKQQ